MHGKFIVILGPDGSGKTTITTLVQDKLRHDFAKLWRFHWRPGLLPKPGRHHTAAAAGAGCMPGSIPEKAAYGQVASAIRFAYYWLDFVLGYWLVIFPRKVRDTLVIGERYFPDIFVHPIRYGFALSNSFMRPFAWFVPSPDLIFLLSDDPDRIFARKGELSIDLIAEQLQKYKKEIEHWGNPVEIDTRAGPERTAQLICEHVRGLRRPA